MTSAPEVWVNEYITGAGVRVAGHFRRRHQGHGTEHEAPATSTATTRPEEIPAVSAPRRGVEQVSTSQNARPEGVGGSVRPLECSSGTGAPPTRLEAAEERYKQASVAAGLAILKRRRGETDDVEIAMRDRAIAKAELATLRAESVESPLGSDRSGEEARGQGPEQERCDLCGQYRDPGHQCPIPEGMPTTSYGDLKGDQRVTAMLADLEGSVRAIVESGQLRRWLDAMSSNGLQRWSANNRMLAALQMAQRGNDLSNLHMMGFRQWEKLGRKVNKGAKAVWILGPITRKVIDEDENGREVERHRVVGFKPIAVFDVSDTNGQPLPQMSSRQTGEVTAGTLEGLKDRVATAGYTYEESEIPGFTPKAGTGTFGFTDPAGKRIVVDPRQSAAEHASTLAHELAHVHCGHVSDLQEYSRHRGRMETEAEMTAYLVNRSRGMAAKDADSFSPGYIAGWSQGDPKVMHSAMDTAVRAYNKIMEGTWPEGSKTT